jgi:ribulose-5-phosphate 4-epimerase/fuculose-1-phosphate aldolase
MAPQSARVIKQENATMDDNGVTMNLTAVEAAAPISPQEWEARVELAAFYRAVVLFKWNEITGNHITLRVPGEPNHFLINPYGLAYSEVTASNLVKIDVEGRLAAPSDYPINLAGFIIHGAVHKVRHDAACVVHTHTVADNAVSAQTCGLLPLNQTSALLYGQVASHPFEGAALDMDEQGRLQRDLGDKPLMILRNHGMLAVGGSVAEAFLLTYYFQRSCEMQVATLSCGAPYELVSEDVARKMAGAFARFRKGTPCIDWEAVKRQLDRIDPGYRR